MALFSSHHNSFLLTFLLTILSFSLSPLSSFAAKTYSNGNETDRLALLAIKAQIIDDPSGVMKSWNDSVHFCNWNGVICGRLHQRVTSLNLSSYDLVGSLSPSIGNLSFLSTIDLTLNHFQHQIPQEIGRLFRLKYLELSNNSFSGAIPGNLSGCSKLLKLRLGFNKLSGRIPVELGSFQLLERVHLHYNNLSGPLPDSLGNLSSTKSLSFAVNNFEGKIPDSFGRLKNLEFLGLGLNRISGMIPSSVYNLSSMTRFSVPFNQLEGNLPSDLGFTLPNLIVFNVGHNLFSGPLPPSLSNASNLVELDTEGSKFTGKVTIDFGSSTNLWWLVLASNSLGTGEADDLNFFESLANCKNIGIIDLSDNKFGGLFPSSISKIPSLVTLRLGSNKLSGNIPEGIGSLVNLTELVVEKNNFTGKIPSAIGDLKMLRKLHMSKNSFSGYILSSLASIAQLYSLHLQKNHLTGPIPSSFGNLSNLQELDLSHNYLNGSIPKEVMSLSSLTVSLNLAQNQLTGSLPSEVGNLKNLGYLDVSENKLSGKIPSELGSCLKLEHLHMESNFFEGTIPSSLSSLRGIQDLDLSGNKLSGEIPKFFQNMSFINLNLSFNQFHGQVPAGGVFRNATGISLVGNEKLCGGIPELHFPACITNKSKKENISQSLKWIIPLLGGLLGSVLIMSILILLRLKKVKRVPSSAPTSSTKDFLLHVSYASLLKATDEFSSANLLGSGSFGSVYKGTLDPNELVVAVKVLQLHERGASKSFMAECEALRNIRHRNLVKLLTVCSSSDFQGNEFKALVYEFMPNGSLESWLQSFSREDDADGELRILSLVQRLNIAIDVASAMDYLHHHCQQPIVHCDLKPSNILLDSDMTAHVGDFGLARFIQEATSRSQPQQTSSFVLNGTIGYAAPEYGMGSKASTHGDVYSYGILLLEIFTGKRPTDEIFKDGLSLHDYVKRALLSRQISEVLDPVFVVGGASGEMEPNSIDISDEVAHSKKEQREECLTAILRVGVACSVETPRQRMDFTDVIKELKLVRKTLEGFSRN
ncbi:probable LRR receptor-like serine/threonine-protein kinase At3g47570 [Humulus lupulus]|uniref:probable LRR receptor-like serine/threonine-protein kinase At3g47570 n=1 Tax=Humulus lupulus TaxID=3486 RepID=UPI002B401303|nr:probable LRR receptor-like serine/threonine-protein kinase At3g47570 [Humulus lupulus]